MPPTRIAACLATLLAGCGTMPMPDPIANETARPSVNASTFATSALRCAGRVIEGQSPTRMPRLIVVSLLRDGAEAPGGTTAGDTSRLLAPHMGQSAIQQMSTNAVIGAADTAIAQRIAGDVERAGYPRPRILHLLGGTLMERSVREEGFQIGGGPNPTSGSAGIDTGDSIYHLTLTTVDGSGIATPGLTYQIEARSRRERRTLRLGISTSTYNASLDFAQTGNSITASQAANTLIQLGVLGVVGQAVGLDVAPCVRRAHADAEHAAWWQAASPAEQRQRAIALMQANRLLPAGNPSANAAAEAAARFQQGRGLPPNGFLDQALYLELRGLEDNREVAVAAGRMPAAPPAAFSPAPAAPPLLLAFDGRGDGRYRDGDDIALRIRMAAGRHVYCFIDTPTGVMRIHPNPWQVNAFVEPEKEIRVPPAGASAPRIVLQSLGRYMAGCVATSRLVQPESLRETRAAAGENMVGGTVREALRAVASAGGEDAQIEVLNYEVRR